MDINKVFGDPDLERNGVWVDYHDGARIKIARLDHPAWQSRFDAVMKPYKRIESQGRLDPEKQIEILCRAYAQGILLDWENFEADGEPLPYSEEVAYLLLCERMDFRDEVTGLAATAEHFRRGSAKDAADVEDLVVEASTDSGCPDLVMRVIRNALADDGLGDDAPPSPRQTRRRKPSASTT